MYEVYDKQKKAISKKKKTYCRKTKRWNIHTVIKYTKTQGDRHKEEHNECCEFSGNIQKKKKN